MLSGACGCRLKTGNNVRYSKGRWVALGNGGITLEVSVTLGNGGLPGVVTALQR